MLQVGICRNDQMHKLTGEIADGYARADGIGALYIKKLSEAVKDGDPIRAVIRGTAVNA